MVTGVLVALGVLLAAVDSPTDPAVERAYGPSTKGVFCGWDKVHVDFAFSVEQELLAELRASMRCEFYGGKKNFCVLDNSHVRAQVSKDARFNVYDLGPRSTMETAQLYMPRCITLKVAFRQIEPANGKLGLRCFDMPVSFPFFIRDDGEILPGLFYQQHIVEYGRAQRGEGPSDLPRELNANIFCAE